MDNGDMDKPMVIVGGGIGGLATALAAARAGLPVQFKNIELLYADLPRVLQSGDLVNAE